MLIQSSPSDMLLRRFPERRPPIAVLCGSTRFYDAFQQANYALTMKGLIVLSVGFYPHAAEEAGHGEGVGHDSEQKVALDELHKRKIDLADFLVVLNVERYIGASTLTEIDYALKVDRPIHFLQNGHTWETVPVGTLVPGSGRVVEKEHKGRRTYVTFDRSTVMSGLSFGGIEEDQPGWFSGCNAWTAGFDPDSKVPVGMTSDGTFAYARRSMWIGQWDMDGIR